MPVVRPVPMTLDKPRSLLFDHRALFDIEPELTRAWGQEYTFFQAIRHCAQCLQPDASGFVNAGAISLTNLSLLLWKGCQHEDPALTLDQVRHALPIYSPLDLLPFVYKVLEAWQAQNPLPQPGDLVQEVSGEDNPLDGSIGNSDTPMLSSISG